MKIRNKLVSNSSSSSYTIKLGAKERAAWPILEAALHACPDLFYNETNGEVEDKDDNVTQNLCWRLGIDLDAFFDRMYKI